MGKYHFGVGNGRVSRKRINSLQRIASEHGAIFCACNIAGRPRYWFSCQNLGSPFDSQRAYAVLMAAKNAGLWPISKAVRP